MNLVYFGSVKDGALKIRNRNALALDLLSLEGKEIEIRIVKKKKTRSNNQNRYYWGVIIPIVKQGLIDAGYPREKISNSEVVHDILKNMFCEKEELINYDTGEILILSPSTTSNSTTQMMDYFEDIKRWCAENLGIYIPDPNEQTSLFEH
ncbi:hypothetical protein [Sphingobacterium faecium]|uniref:hypothetical protein n=1 Tax=Sphingobacterium faecium TaxID=34087 RepID=UPI0024784C24|nr:hypothetical protein [Sphingobacterium faecium]WGQ15613.1 hypothetical protein QG727_04205 [Sphingobacterium faecium]